MKIFRCEVCVDSTVAAKAIHAKLAAHVLMSLGHSSVIAQRDSLALDAKQVCLQSDMTAHNRPDNTVTALMTLFGWLRFLVCVPLDENCFWLV